MDNSYVNDIIKIEYIKQGYLPNIPYHMITDQEMLYAFFHTDSSFQWMPDPSTGDIITIGNYESANPQGFFIDHYPCPSEDLMPQYIALLNSIMYCMYVYMPILGDINLDGVTDMQDVWLLRRYLSGIVSLTEQQKAIADINGDGKVTVKDLLLLRQLVEYGQEEGFELWGLQIPDWLYSYMLGEVISQESPIQDRHNLLVLLGTDNIYDEFDKESALACYEISKQYVAKTNAKRAPTIFGEPHVIKMRRLETVEI